MTERVLATADTSTNILLDKLMERLIWVLSRGGIEHPRLRRLPRSDPPRRRRGDAPGVTLGSLIAEGTFPFITPPIELVGDGLGASVAAAPAAAREMAAATPPAALAASTRSSAGATAAQGNVSRRLRR